MQAQINKILLSHIKSHNITYDMLASNLGITRSGLYKMLRSPYITAINLQKISAAIGYNFFQHLYSDSDHPTPEQWHELRKANSLLRRENTKLLEQVQVLTQTNQLLSAQLGLIHPSNQPPKT